MGIGHLAHRFDINLSRFHLPSNSAGIPMAGITKTLLAILLLLPLSVSAHQQSAHSSKNFELPKYLSSATRQSTDFSIASGVTASSTPSLSLRWTKQPAELIE